MAELFAKYNCTNCQDDIPGIRVHCAECVDFDLCIQCFASGAEIGPHRNDHRYQLTDSAGTVQLSRAKGAWSGCEELRLLDAIEKYGFGNWEDVSVHIETRTPAEAKDEYIAKYLNGCIGRNTWPHEQLPRLVDHTVADKGPLSQLLTQRLPPIDATAEEAAQLQFMPHRNDFEREYDPTAETLISTLHLSPDDDETDIVLQLAQVDIYTRKLRERTRRKRMVQDYQLISQFFRGGTGVGYASGGSTSASAVAAARRRQTKDQREFRDRYRVFAQFYTSTEWSRRLADFEREKALRVRLSELYRYRWNGLQRVADAVHFEQHAAVVQQTKNLGPYGQLGKTGRAIGERQPSSMPPSQQPKRTPSAAHAESEKHANSSSTGPKSMRHIDDPDSCDGSSHSRSYSDSTTLGGQPQPSAMLLLPSEVVEQPGGQLLSTSEIHLCSNLNLPATRYVTLKTVILSRSVGGVADADAGSSGYGSGKYGSNGSRISGDNCSRGTGTVNIKEQAIVNFLTKAGWLQHAGA